MILIKNIEIEEVLGDYVEVYEEKCTKFGFNTVGGKPTKEQTKVYWEVVDGRKFINERGQSVCIGTTKEIQATLGLCFKVFEKQNNTIDLQYKKIRLNKTIINKLEQTIANHKNMSFLKRIRFLFKGKIK